MKSPAPHPEEPTASESVAVYYDLHQHKPALIASAAAVAFSSVQRIGEIAGASFRGKLPDSLDFTEHIANTADTIVAAGAAMFAINALRVARGRGIIVDDDPKGYEIVSSEEAFAKMQRAQAATVLMGSLAINAFVESDFFNSGSPFSADKVDVLYGLIGGLLAYLSLKPNILDTDESRAVIQNAIKSKTAGEMNHVAINKPVKSDRNISKPRHYGKRKRTR